jgi:hypothetical protein
MRIKNFSNEKRFLSTNNRAALEAFFLQTARQIRSFSILVLKSHSQNIASTVAKKILGICKSLGKQIKRDANKSSAKTDQDLAKEWQICNQFVK